MKRFIIQTENRAWPYDYGPRKTDILAIDAEAARQMILQLDPLATVLRVSEVKSDAP